MAITRKKKEEIIEQLVNNFKKAKSVVFSQYKGTNVKDMHELRKNLRLKKVLFKIAKKTLVNIAAKKAGLAEIPGSLIPGPIGLAFGMEEEIAPAKILHEFGRTHETIKVVGAIFEGKLREAAEAQAIAALPGKEILLGQLVGLLKSPIVEFHAILHALLRNFVYVLKSINSW